MDDLANTKKMNKFVFLFYLGLSSLLLVSGNKHKLKVENDLRATIDLTTFGFLQRGFLQVNITGFSTGLPKPSTADGLLGFTLTKLESTGKSLLEGKQSACILKASERSLAADEMALIVFSLDFSKKLVTVQRHGKDVQNLSLSLEQHDVFDIPGGRRRRSLDYLRDSVLLSRSRRQATGNAPTKPAVSVKIPPIPVIPVDPSPPAGVSAPNAVGTPVLNGTPDVADTAALKNKTLIPGVDKNPKNTVQPLVEKYDQSDDNILHNNSSKDEQKEKSNAVPKTSNPESGMREETGGNKDGVITDSFSMTEDGSGVFSFMFVAEMLNKNEEGLYELYFHNCLNIDGDPKHSLVNFSAYLIEKNDDNYLSAGHIPLPFIFSTLSCVFFAMACVWLWILKKSGEGVYKLHYLMLSLIYIKAVSLLFHAVNYHFLATQGHHEEAIAIIYYITYLTRGILLFVTIILIGAGWAFVKYILSDRDKKIFLIVIPLQILANVAQIVVEETEEGQSQYITWSEIFIIVDLLCCGAILFPVVWSIRHLQEASQTDGKAAINLVKLKLFRHFYIMIVCYIYFTRIIVYLLKIAVPFQYVWMDDLFREIATLVFYVVTGYKFRPASDNPYLQVPQESDDELEMDEVVTQSGALEGLTKVNVKFNSGSGESTTSASKRESSHEYD